MRTRNEPWVCRFPRYLALGTLLTSLLTAHAAQAQISASAPQAPLSLAGAVEEALRQRPLLGADTERIEAAKARVAQARAGLLPRIELQGVATDGPQGAPNLGPLVQGLAGTPLKKHTGGSLNLTQTLLDFGRTQNLVRARHAEVTGSREVLQADQNRVALEVQQAYLAALQARRLVAVNRQILEQRQTVARQATTLMQNGLASRVEVDLADVSVAQAQLAVVRAQNEVETAFAALSTAIGRPLTSTTPLEDVVPAGTPAPPPTSAALLPSLEESLATALRERPELRRGTAQVRAFEHLTAAARAAKRPLLTGVASVGKVNPVPLFEATDKPWAVGVALTLPIFTGGLLEGQVEEARRNANAARGDLGELNNVVRQQVTGAIANLAAAEESVRVAHVQLVQAQDALSLATQRYQAQLGSIVELTQAQVVYATAQNDLVRAQYDRELARAAFAFATGQRYLPAASGGK